MPFVLSKTSPANVARKNVACKRCTLRCHVIDVIWKHKQRHYGSILVRCIYYSSFYITFNQTAYLFWDTQYKKPFSSVKDHRDLYLVFNWYLLFTWCLGVVGCFWSRMGSWSFLHCICAAINKSHFSAFWGMYLRPTPTSCRTRFWTTRIH
jgi:hypothetical protein